MSELREGLIKRVGISYSIIRDIKCELDNLKKELSQIEEGLRRQKEEPKALTYEEEKDFVNKWLGGSEGYSLADWDPTEDRTRWPQIFQRINDKGLIEEFTQKVVDVIGIKIEKWSVLHGGFLLMETEAPTLWKALLEMLQERLA